MVCKKEAHLTVVHHSLSRLLPLLEHHCFLSLQSYSPASAPISANSIKQNKIKSMSACNIVVYPTNIVGDVKRGKNLNLFGNFSISC